MSEYKIKLAKPSGGKAGTGRNKTSTVQVIRDNMIIKMFRFLMDDPESLRKAKAKAEAFCKDLS